MNYPKYFKKLVEVVDGEGYTQLLYSLYSRPYHCKNSYDVNRLREIDDIRSGYNGGQLRQLHSILELLIVLAKSMEDRFMHDSEKGDRTSSWFWMILQNAGLTHWDDKRVKLYPEAFNDEVDVWAKRFIDHEYGTHGENGGIFPLRESKRDIRKVDLWTQMNWYVTENFREDLYL